VRDRNRKEKKTETDLNRAQPGSRTISSMTGKRADTLLEVMYRIEQFTLGRVWESLSDEELFWEPVPGAWSVRRRADCRTRHPFGSDEWVIDFDVDVSASDNEPMTTIGWLLWHVASMPGRLTEIDFLGGGHSMASGWTSPYLTHHPIFTRATDATETLRQGWVALRSALEGTDDAQLETRTPRYTYATAPPTGGLCALGPPGPEHSVVFFVAGTLNEISHHGSQICTLRDLYAART